MNDSFYNQKIISIERALTSGKGASGKKYPMWKCRLESGKTVNAFQHDLPERNSHRLFDQYPEIDEMDLGDVLLWTDFPIECRCAPDGDFLKLVTLAPRKEDARPDFEKPAPDEVPNSLTLAQSAVQQWAKRMVESGAVIIDFETDEASATAEVLSVAVIDTEGTTLCRFLVNPTPGMVFRNRAEHINGITSKMLQDAPSLAQIVPLLSDVLSNRVVLAYNADFDIPVLQNAMLRAGYPPIIPLVGACVMKMYAMYRGQWDYRKKDWRWARLSEAAESFGIETPSAHDALADVRTTLEVLRQMAAGVQPKQQGGW